MTAQLGRSTYGLLSAIAQSGECLDCAAIEAKLRTIGFSADEAREALLDAEDRAALQALCVAAQDPAREQRRMQAEAAFRELTEK